MSQKSNDKMKPSLNNLKDPNNSINWTGNSATLIVSKPTSLSTLIVWNITKAMETNPALDIKGAITEAQSRLEQVADSQEVSGMLCSHLHERHLTCALLAWQQLGHKHTDSLLRFYENKRFEEEGAAKSSGHRPKAIESPTVSQCSKASKFSKAVDSSSCNSYSMGPVVKLPVKTKIVMRVENNPVPRKPAAKSEKKNAKDDEIMKKINQACCLDTACAQRLAALDSLTSELRTRAGLLARREAERVQLLERAEAAWKDLELGYQRRLALALEKEEDINREIQRVIVERNDYKAERTTLAKLLTEHSEKAEKDRVILSQVEKEVCCRACTRLKLSEEAVKGDRGLAEQQCRAAQMDRDLLFKEEQARRKQVNLQSELESVRALSYESERALREELSALRDQAAQVSQRLLDEDADSERVKIELEDYRQEKAGLVEDLEGCKVMCEGRMQGKVDELKKKKDQLAELQDKVMECRCKEPVDVNIEVKRTPSLAALCHCTPEDKVLKSCSCTSLRGRLLSNLLADLFSGLQSELPGSVTEMPCQLLKCLEDKHDWDRASIVKTSLKNYFSQLLVGELDIAIATSIEKYHAKWVGSSCADTVKKTLKSDDDESEGWQERAIERRAQKLATKLAEQLFKDRADQLAQKAKDIVASGPPPCECRSADASAPEVRPGGTEAAMYPCLLKPRQAAKAMSVAPVYWHQAINGVTHLRRQIEDLKKDSIKKEDLKNMENKFTKIIQQASGGAKSNNIDIVNSSYDSNKKEQKINRPGNNSALPVLGINKPIVVKKSNLYPNYQSKKGNKSIVASTNTIDRPFKQYKKNGLTYAVNMCLCSLPKDQQKTHEKSKVESSPWKQKVSKDNVSQSSTIRQSKPITASLLSQEFGSALDSKTSEQQSCRSNCICFHKIPSNTSLDKLLETLTKWKCDLDSSCSNNRGGAFNKCNIESILDVQHSLSEKKNRLISDENIKSSPKQVKSNTTAKSEVMKEDSSKVNKLDLDCQNKTVDEKQALEQIKMDLKHSKNSKTSEKLSAKSIGPILTTESEYMGDINLDKSYEVFCKCNDNNKRYKIKDNENKSPTFKCITTSKCHCEKKVAGSKLETKTSLKKEILLEDISKPKHKIQNEVTKLQNIAKNKVNNDIHKREKGLHDTVQDIKSITKSLGPCDCDYQIKFLGVTLADVSSHTKTKHKKLHVSGVNKGNDYLDENNLLTNTLVRCDNFGIGIKGITETNKYKSDEGTQHEKNVDNTIESTSIMPKCKQGNVKNKYTSESNLRSIENNINYEHFDSNKDLIFNSSQDNITKTTGNSILVSQNDKINPNPLKLSGNMINVKNSNKQYCQNTSCKIESCSKNQIKLSENEINKNADHKMDTIVLKNEEKETRRLEKNNNDVSSFLSNKNIHEMPRTDENIEYNKTDVKVCEKSPSCECTDKFHSFKNFINYTFAKQTANEDIGLDVQSFKDYKVKYESCICCDKSNIDESKDLEENAFHLLEDYLKKKLDEFKNTSCISVCIPPEEEEKLFKDILQRVKKLIADSTNLIACKCTTESGKSQGSWNRAYSLLQEYLKMKIKRVQCSCVLTEDNNDTILPDVLGKVCNLIEYDFQRLKNVCGCKNDPTTSEAKPVNFGKEVPEKEIDLISRCFKDNAVGTPTPEVADKVTTATSNSSIIIKQNMSSQVTSDLEIEYGKTKNTVQPTLNLNNTVGLIATNSDCNCAEKINNDQIPQRHRQPEIIQRENNVESSVYHRKSIEKSKDVIFFKDNKTMTGQNYAENNHNEQKSCPYIDYTVECVCKESLNRKLDHRNVVKVSTDMDIFKSSTKESRPVKVCYKINNSPINNVKSNIQQPKNFHITDDRHLIEIKSEKHIHYNNMQQKANSRSQSSDFVGKYPISKHQCNFVLNKNEIINKNECQITPQNHLENNYNAPYVGYTIDCTCDGSLGTCVCSKSIPRPGNNTIRNIWKSSKPNESYLKKVSYIMNTQPMNKNDFKSDYSQMPDDVYLQSIQKKHPIKDRFLHECVTEMSINVEEDMVLKKSMQDVDRIVLANNFSHINSSTHRLKNEEFIKSMENFNTDGIIKDIHHNKSVDTDNSNNEETLDWCECCSHIKKNKSLDSAQLKNSIYFPTPINNIENFKDETIAQDDSLNILSNKVRHCECDMVPVCHVKMLMQSIEDKLVASQCTCDSLMPKVCPVHSPRC